MAGFIFFKIKVGSGGADLKEAEFCFMEKLSKKPTLANQPC
jgi:hypothetical protein